MEKNMRHPVSLVTLIFLSLIFGGVCSSSSHHLHRSYDHQDPKHFVLVHGACLGAWSWYKMVALLESYGHNVTAIDLAASGINLARADQLQTFSDYTKPLMEFMESIPPTQRVILVGHSFGGAAISQAMELFSEKISVGVFLTAAMPGPSLPLSDIVQKSIKNFGSALDNKLIYDNGPNNSPTSFIFGPKYTSQVIYQYSPPQDAALAIMLVRPLKLTNVDELVFTKDKYGSVKRIFIMVEKDQVLPKEDQERMIEKNPPDRVETISNSDHMAMASQPIDLLAHLLGIAQDFA